MDLIGLDIEQTIAAVSTPPGSPEAPCLRSVVRLSGPECLRIASAVFQPAGGAHLADVRGFGAIDGLVCRGPRVRLPAVAWCFRGPRSYSGQDMIELHLPGSAALAGQVVEGLLAAGARAAQPGEFTLRAVLGGRIDLTGAEAIAELIAARGDGQLRAAMQLADGVLVRRVAAINDALADVLAEVEAGLDFADEPIQFITADRVGEALRSARGALAELRLRCGAFETLEHRPTVALVGRPNAGKSTLLNRLSGLERALCSPLAGTTRDVLAAPLSLDDGEALLLDGAGLAEGTPLDASGSGGTRLIASGTAGSGGGPDEAGSSGGALLPGDDLERAAGRAMLHAARSADLLLFVLDAMAEARGQLTLLEAPELAGRPVLLVRNKIDLSGGSERRGAAGALDASAATGQGVPDVLAAINALLFSDRSGGARTGEGLMLNARHRAALAEADAELAQAEHLLADSADSLGGCADLLAGRLGEAIARLGQISGQVVTEDILSRIFSRFCLGK